ncbi:MAG: hypothetical protein A2Y20_04910 [Firmicutes bacterium GWF2_51_9]|nr:MAG: hypothetical protein A2Y20_04910 [Firmicutes bacterium GWF2_51_9]OGS57408.1 MAG: hypothetical protein A2Y19_02785 [Firmicutes bacterium GWE2_51_13]HAM63149.1 hypothetical protein [Erysipelotrichaceae bacterium]HBZ41527.1 hypothetical protein [Erysipelotrichaceae bacterium]
MEKYYIAHDSWVPTVGFYSRKVIKLYSDKYSEKESQRLFENALEVLRVFVEDNEIRNILAIGKIQSGKTANLEMLCALAFDNDVKIIVIFGGYDNSLLDQTNIRFAETFGIKEDPEIGGSNTPLLFTTDKKSKYARINSLHDQLIDDIVHNGHQIFITTIKRKDGLESVNELLLKILEVDRTIQSLVIDDEGDQASLNTKKNKEKNFSPTYSSICKMKDILGNPKYLSVTATPQANMFLDKFSRIKPQKLILLKPGNGYTGGDFFHSGDRDSIVQIDDNENDAIENSRIPKGLYGALAHFLIGSSIMEMRGKVYSEMIVHSFRGVDKHSKILILIDNYINQLKEFVNKNETELQVIRSEFETVYHKMFDEKTTSAYTFEEVFNIVKTRIKSTYVIIRNSKTSRSDENLGLKKNRIYIGGDLLQRGITFKYLVTAYFSRWAETGNMDTSLQRARWFGYRSEYIEILRLFVTKEISEEYGYLCDIEEDMWEQYQDIVDGNQEIDHFVVSGENTMLRPTRTNVVDYYSTSKGSKWIKQRIGVFEQKVVENNNNIINEFISEQTFSLGSFARLDGILNYKFTCVDGEKLLDSLKRTESIFDSAPLLLSSLVPILTNSRNVNIVIMNDITSPRERTFDDENRINNLHQGPDKADQSERKYDGDSKAYVNKNEINLQIHFVTPKRNGVKMTNLSQYMFAIYAERGGTYFVRKGV